MKKHRLKIIIFILAGILLAKIIVTLVALPKITIDYVARYNELTKPAEFAPERNAADHIQKACELYIIPSTKLRDFNSTIRRNEEATQIFNSNDPNSLLLLEKWIVSNKPALDQIKLAIQKPYCWFERKSEKGYASGILCPERSTTGDLSRLLISSAKLNVYKNNFRASIDDIIDCYRVGQLYCRENLSIIEQFMGTRIRQDAVKTALYILPHSSPGTEELKHFQDSLQTILDNDSYIMGSETEKIFMYDAVQRIFLDWKRGINRPAFRLMNQFRCMCNDNNFLWINAFVGPSRHEVIRQIDRLFELYDQLRDKTQWQIHHQYTEQLDEIDKIVESNFFMKILAPPLHRIFSTFQDSNAQTEALIAVLAILRFQADNSKLPATLEELISSGYLKNLPKDPYSEGNLIYRIIGDEFKLYSIGKDFEDNNGELIITEEKTKLGFPRMPGMLPAYPPSAKKDKKFARKIKPTTGKVKKTEYKDIIYWPVIENMVKYERIEK